MLLERNQIEKTVRKRVNQYKNEEEAEELEIWFNEHFQPLLDQIRIESITWEATIDNIKSPLRTEIDDFYQKCLELNQVTS